MAVVLAGAGLFVYLRLRSDLDESVTAGLAARAAAVLAANAASAGAAGDAEEGFAQLLSPDRPRARQRRRHPRSGAQPSRAAARRGGRADPRGAQRARHRGSGARAGPSDRDADVVAVGQSLDDRDETLGNLVASFAIGGPIAVLVASLLGYALAAAGLRPVEAMRRRAQEVSLNREDERLAAAGGPRRDPPPRRDAQRDARPPRPLVRARAPLRGRRQPRAAHAGGGHQGRAGGSAARRRTRSAGPRGAGRVGRGMRSPRPAGRGPADRRAHERGRAARAAASRSSSASCSTASGGASPTAPASAAAAITVDAGDARSVYADELRLGQALGNLVDNALRYGAGEIALRSRRARVRPGARGLRSRRGLRPRVRRARVRALRPRRPRPQRRDGTGLGLSIVRAIAEAHGGRAEVVAGRRRDRPHLAARRPGHRLRVISSSPA